MERAEGIPVRQPDTFKGDKLRVEIICGNCRDPGTAFFHEEPRYSMQGIYVRRSFFCDSCDHREYFVPLDASIKSTTLCLIVRSTMLQRARSGDEKALAWAEKIRQRLKGHRHARKAKAAEGD